MALVATIGIAMLQAIWFKSNYDDNEKKFDQNVRQALTKISKRILEYNNNPNEIPNPVKQLSEAYYVVLVNDHIDSSILEHYLFGEFKQYQNIGLSFVYSIYDCENKKLITSSFIDGNPTTTVINQKLPEFKNDNYFFSIYFPNKTKHIIETMGLWLYSTGVVLLVIFFFSYSLLVILKQRRLSEIQRDFINNMTHEIKTPISTIAVSAETLKNPKVLESPQRLFMYATIIQEEANRLKTQVERVLQVARSESRVRIKKEPFDIHELLEDVAQAAQVSTKDKPVTLELHLDAKAHQLLADKMHIANIFTNLVENAIKYSPNEAKVELYTSSSRKKIEVKVRDHGVGIAKPHQRKIFDKFYRVSTGNIHDVKGFGLGLHYVWLMVRAHNGKISVDSTPGSGTTFTITLPFT